MKIEIKTVINSINNNEGNLCVDIFKRNNQTFGFEEYRRDVLGLSQKNIEEDLEAIWVPNKTWSSFLEKK